MYTKLMCAFSSKFLTQVAMNTGLVLKEHHGVMGKGSHT